LNRGKVPKKTCTTFLNLLWVTRLMVAWANPLGLYSLLVLIPFIILYLIRPRPKEVSIPSLMFFIKERGVRQRSSFLKNFVRDLLFLIQLLLLLALCFSLAEPAFDVISAYKAEQTAIVLDVSASMTADGRFEKARNFALKNLGKRTTIILAKDIPVTILEDGDSTAARAIIKNLKATGSNSNIGDAMKTAGDKLAEGRVVVASDFIHNKGLDPLVAKSILESKGLTVDLFTVTGGTKNIGIIDVRMETKERAKIFVKNFNENKEQVTVQVGNLKKELSIDAGASEIINIKPPEGITKIEIINKDDMPADNIAYINVPKQKPVRALLVTNNNKNFLKAALNAIPNIDLEISVPPILPKMDHDIVIFSQVKIDKILPGTFEDLEKHIVEGNAVIFTGQERIPTTDLMPFIPSGYSKQGASSAIDILNQLTKGVEFGRVSNYHKGRAPNGSLVLVSTEYNDPLLVINEMGKGYSIYYGIFDAESDFKLSPSYPIFWSNLLTFLSGKDDLTRYNKRTGDLVTLNSPRS